MKITKEQLRMMIREAAYYVTNKENNWVSDSKGQPAKIPGKLIATMIKKGSIDPQTAYIRNAEQEDAETINLKDIQDPDISSSVGGKTAATPTPAAQQKASSPASSSVSAQQKTSSPASSSATTPKKEPDKSPSQQSSGPFSKAYEAHRAVLEKIIPSLPVPQEGIAVRLEKFSKVFKDIDAKKEPSYTNAQGIDIKIPDAQKAVNLFFSGVLNSVTNSLFDNKIISDESGHEGMKQSIDLYRALRKVVLSDKFPGSSPVAPDIGENVDTQQMRVVGRSGSSNTTVGGVKMLGDFTSKIRPEVTVGNYFLEKEKRQQMKESIKITKSYLKQIIKEEIQKVLK